MSCFAEKSGKSGGNYILDKARRVIDFGIFQNRSPYPVLRVSDVSNLLVSLNWDCIKLKVLKDNRNWKAPL